MAEERAAGEAAAADDDTACRDRVRAVCGGQWGSARCAHAAAGAALDLERWFFGGLGFYFSRRARARSLAELVHRRNDAVREEIPYGAPKAWQQVCQRRAGQLCVH